MQRGRRWGILALLLASACQVHAPVATHHPQDVHPAATDSPATGASLHPPSSPAASVAPTPGAPHLLRAPATPTVKIATTIRIDASYLVANNAGSVIANNAGNIVAAGGGRLDASGALIANNGGALVASGGGNVIANNAGNVISEHGAGVISDHGVGVVSQHGGSFRILAAPMAAYGELLPAAGMAVRVRSLRTGELVPIGVDDANQPVYGVYSNLAGRVELYLPASEAGNVLVEADVPDTSDERQRYRLVTSPTATTVPPVDEDTAQVARYMRLVFAARAREIMLNDPATLAAAITNTAVFPDGIKPILSATLAELHGAAVAAGITADPAMEAAVTALAYRIGDALLSHIDLDQLVLSHTTYVSWGSQPGESEEPAVPAMTEIMRALREAARDKLVADPHFFDHQPYFELANACKPAYYTIKKPTDVEAMFVSEYLGTNQIGDTVWARQMLASVGVGKDAKTGVDQGRRLSAGIYAVGATLVTSIFTNQDGVKDEMLALVKAFDPKRALSADEKAIPAFPTICPHPTPSPTDAPASPDAGASTAG